MMNFIIKAELILELLSVAFLSKISFQKNLRDCKGLPLFYHFPQMIQLMMIITMSGFVDLSTKIKNAWTNWLKESVLLMQQE